MKRNFRVLLLGKKVFSVIIDYVKNKNNENLWVI